MKKIVILTGLVLCIYNTIAQQCFSGIPAQSIYSLTSQSQRFGIADFNNDNIKDVYVAETGTSTSKVEILLGTVSGQFTFTTAITHSSFNTVIDAAAEDLDKDGNMDLVVASRSSKILTLFSGNGNGTFTYSTQIATNQFLVDIETGDFNNDTYPDIAAISSGTNLSVYFNNAGTGFNAPVNYSIVATASQIQSADINHDGALDLLTANNTNKSFSVFFGSASGTFSAAVNYTVAANGSPFSITVNDLNNDGHQDVALSCRDNLSIVTYFGNSAGAFAFNSISYQTQNFSPYKIISADVNQDLYADLVVLDDINYNFEVIDGSAGYLYNTIKRYAVEANGRDILCNDIDSDGSLELLILDSQLKIADIANGKPVVAENFLTKTNATGITTADFNNDGRLDFALCHDFSNQVSVMMANAANGYSLAQTYTVGTRPNSVVSDDTDGDSFADLIVSNYNMSKVSVLKGFGNGTFTLSAQYPVQSGPGRLCLANLNNDSNKDVVVTNYFSNSISVLPSNGNGTFGTAINIPVGTNPTDVLSSDFNNDGINDVAISNYTDSSLYVLYSNGNFSFTNQPVLRTGKNPSAIVSNDFNNDGYRDLAVVNTGAKTMYVYFNSVAGFTSSYDSYVIGNSASDITSGDFDQDGSVDIAVSCATPGKVYYFAGSSTGTFTFKTSYQVNYNAKRMLVADFDGNASDDIALCNDLNNNQLSMLYNCGSFTATSIHGLTAAEDLYKVFPNPFNGYLAIEAVRNEVCMVEFYNMLGELVMSWPVSSDQATINTMPLKQGLYILLLKDKSNVVLQKNKLIKR